MAVHLRTASLFKTSRILFRKDDGTPYRFYYEHDSDDLRRIINKGHGYLVNDPSEADILLCEKKTDNRITQGYLPINYIVDCIKRNTVLNMNTYRDDVLGLKASASKDESLNSRMRGKDDSEEEANLMKFAEPFRIQVNENGLMGRKKYSDLDDLKIIKYLINHKKYTETGGNIVWKQMELVKVTDHSHQSMKDRFRKIIRPEIDTYEIPATWKSKLRANYTDDGPSSDEELYEDTTFNYIDEWNNKLKECSNKKKLMQSAQVQKKTSPNRSSTRIAVNDPPSDASGAPSSASPMKNSSTACLGGKNVANLNDSDLEAITISNSDNLLQVQRQSGDKSDHRSGNLMESVLHQHANSANKEKGTQNVDYIYDDLDCLILSEANKCQNADGADTVSNQADGRTRVTAVSEPEAVRNVSCVEMPPIHSRNLSQLYNNTETRDTRKGKVILNIYTGSVNAISSKSEGGDVKNCNNSGSVNATSSKREGRNVKNCNSSNQQKAASDKVIEVSEQMNSINTICDVFKKGSAKSRKETHSLLSKNHNSEVEDVESDTFSAKDQNENNVDENNVEESDEISPNAVNKKTATRKGSVSKSRSNSSDSVEYPLLHIKAPMPNHKSRHVSLMAGPSGVQSLSKRPEKEKINKNNVSKPVENASKKALTKLSLRKASVKPHSDSVESIDVTSNRHLNSPSKAASSSRNKRALGSGDSCDGSTSVNSPHKKKCVQQSTLGRPAAESTSLSIASLQSPLRQGKSPDWCSKEKTLLKIEYLCKMYELEVNEAALLLKFHKGCFLSTIKLLESRPCDETTNARTTEKT